MNQFLLFLIAFVASTSAQFLIAPENITVTIGLLDDLAEEEVDVFFNSDEVDVTTPVTVRTEATDRGFLEIRSGDLSSVNVDQIRTLGGDTNARECVVTEIEVRTSTRNGSGRRRTEIDTSTACSLIEISGDASDVERAIRRITFSFEDEEEIFFRTTVDNTDEDTIVLTFVNREISALGIILAACCTISICCGMCIAGAWFCKVHMTSGPNIQGYADQENEKKDVLNQENNIATPVNNYNVAVPQQVNNYNVAVPQQQPAYGVPQPVAVQGTVVPVAGGYPQGQGLAY